MLDATVRALLVVIFDQRFSSGWNTRDGLPRVIVRGVARPMYEVVHAGPLALSLHRFLVAHALRLPEPFLSARIAEPETRWNVIQ